MERRLFEHMVTQAHEETQRMTTQHARDEESGWALMENNKKSNPEEDGLVAILGEIAKLEKQRATTQAALDKLQAEIVDLREKHTQLGEELQAIVEVRSRWLNDLFDEYPWFKVYPKDSGDDVK